MERPTKRGRFAQAPFSYFDQLSDDLVVRIFQSLQFNERIPIRTVCKRWRTLSDDPRIWRTLRLTSPRFLKEIIERFPLLESLNLSCQPLLQSEQLRPLNRIKSSLTSLDISRCEGLTGSVLFLIGHLTNLKTLVLNRSQKISALLAPRPQRYQEAFLELSRLFQLETLHMENVHLEIDSLVSICKGLTRLTSLRFSLDGQHMPMTVCFPASLTELVISPGSSGKDDHPQVKQQTPLPIEHLSQLRVLNLKGIIHDSDVSVSYFSRATFTGLYQLNLAIHDAADCDFSFFSRLVSLSILRFGCRKDSRPPSNFVKNLMLLRSLDQALFSVPADVLIQIESWEPLSRLSKMDINVAQSGEILQSISKCPSLTELNMKLKLNVHSTIKLENFRGLSRLLKLTLTVGPELMHLQSDLNCLLPETKVVVVTENK